MRAGRASSRPSTANSKNFAADRSNRMSTMPMRRFDPHPEPPPPFKRFFFFVLGVLGLFVLIFSGRAWTWFRPVVQKPLINKYAGEYKMDPLWVMSIIKVESRFAPNVESRKGAVGLMQLLPSTARELAPEIGLTHFEDD